jgi:hypothetical protein
MPGVLLGSIQFVEREIPDFVPWGGKQQLAIHKLLGGTRVIDAMGPDPNPIKWSGNLYATKAHPLPSVRARQIDAMRKAGAQVSLTWGSFNYLVVVQEFQAIYKHEWQIAYTITCEVVTDNPAQSVGKSVTLDQTIVNDFNAIAGLTTADLTIDALLGIIVP